MGTDTFCFKCWDSIFSYEEPRVVRIRSISLGVIYWSIMLAVLLFVILYLIFYSNGYQQFDPVDGAVTTKLFGVVKPNDTGSSSFRPVWDNADYMVPPKENGAFTVITSVLVTQGQVQSTCDEDPSIRGAQCEVHENCTAEKALLYGNGVMTGYCIGSTHAPDINVCQINAWCPVEINNSSKRMFLASENFTAFIRNNVKFPAFDRKRQNFPDNMDDKELGSCVFDPGHPRNRHCPIFKISTIAQEAGYSFNSMMIEGAVIEIIIKWDCNFDCDDECLPTYSFHRLDRVHHPASRGFHLRYADHYTNQNGQSVRTLYRAYGIRVIVTVNGSGRKFSPYVTAKTVGSGMSYFGFAAFVVSLVILRLYKLCCKKKRCLEDCCCTRCAKCLQKCVCVCACWTGSYDCCCCKPFEENSSSNQDRHVDDLTETTFVFRDALKVT
ncbi:P2X purinoceptor 4-like [Littorina saxatilis]|uniref:P2X purinoceptor 4-like n=1 Tax=Littorina saxatilis TaxID=31220 RepID=UPI0038B55AEA